MHGTGNNSVIAALILAATTYGKAAHASVGFEIEAISDYTFICNGSHDCDTDMVTEAQGFNSVILDPGWGLYSPWASSPNNQFWPDDQAWDVDYYDPDSTYDPNDNDWYPDNSGINLSLWWGHGSCSDTTNTPCTSDANCPSGYCPVFPLPLQPGRNRACINESNRYMVTSSPINHHANVIAYGSLMWPYNVRLGESSSSGGWAGAGTNGGTNVSVIVNSCGIRSRYSIYQTAMMFAGLHLLMMTMPTAAWVDGAGNKGYSDTQWFPARGSGFAFFITSCLDCPAHEAWLHPSLVYNGFGTAPNGGGDRDGGPASGAHIVIACDTSQAASDSRLNTETWNQTFDDSRDAQGIAACSVKALCNYDCTTSGYPLP